MMQPFPVTRSLNCSRSRKVRVAMVTFELNLVPIGSYLRCSPPPPPLSSPTHARCEKTLVQADNVPPRIFFFFGGGGLGGWGGG